MKRTPDVIYLDYHSTTPCDPRVVGTMLPFFTESCANPSNGLHALGRSAAHSVDEARQQVADLIGSSPNEIVFTGGATESNNLAILGLAQRVGKRRNKLVISSIEHKSVLEVCQYLAGHGYELAYLPVGSDGIVDIDAAADCIDDRTLLVSVQAANNEIGTIQPIAALGKLAHAHGSVFHCDGAQAVGKIPVDVGDLDIDLLSISAHKLYGPKGVGALFVRGGATTNRLSPTVYGGGQENGLRPGTLNVPGIVGFGKACSLCLAEMGAEARKVETLRNALEGRLLMSIPDVQLNGSLRSRLPGNISLTFLGVDADALLLNLPELALSTGSACTSGTLAPSHVLAAIGLSRDAASSTIRVGIGRFTTDIEIDIAAGLIVGACQSLRAHTTE
jgi:cysteine desulfurase